MSDGLELEHGSLVVGGVKGGVAEPHVQLLIALSGIPIKVE